MCPVPLRMSPESPLLQSSDEDSPQTIGRQPGPKVRSTGGFSTSRISEKQCFGSGLDPDSVRSVDPYPDPES